MSGHEAAAHPEPVAVPVPPASAPGDPVFVTGSTMRHVLVMTATGTVGLMAIFFVDLLSLLYIAQLRNPVFTAAVGYGAVVLFIAISLNVGLMIAVTALVARALGSRRHEEARQLAGTSLAWMIVGATFVTAAGLPLIPPLLGLLGATGETLELAHRFLMITLPANVLMALGMGCSGLLRAIGDARRAMWVTLSGAIVTAGLDPLLILGFGWGVEGAAIATVVSRAIFVIVGLNGTVRVHRMIAMPTLASMRAGFLPMFAIAGPAVLTNLAPPAANAVLVAILARFGDLAIAASAIVDRLTPVAFGALFALSGAIGPILAQNWGAGQYDRVRQALRDALLVAALYVLTVWAILALGRYQVAGLFAATGLTADLVIFFCLISGPTWIFLGALFVANAAFNNLGHPIYSTLFNWGRATLGTVPFAWVGAELYGPYGVLAGTGLGAVVFGIVSVLVAFRVVARPPAP